MSAADTAIQDANRNENNGDDASASPRPDLTVVVALISGRKDDVRHCLEALATQDERDAPVFEVVVPWDSPCADITELAADFPDVRFVEAAHLDTTRARAGTSREHHDTLRRIGLESGRGRYLALTEDHTVPSPVWCRDMVRLLDAHPQVGAIGGAVEYGIDRMLQRAIYYCDFGRYRNPLPEGPAEYVSDSNVAYRRGPLWKIHDVWKDDYHEPLVHWGLVEAGYETWLSPGSEVAQTRRHLTWREAFRERYVWGRSFAGTRTTKMSPARRISYAVLSPALPWLMTGRLVRGELRKRRDLGKFLRTVPLIFVFQIVWAFGEFVGYVTKDPGHV